jgi:uncharacterized membrane protein YdbT with pleckstrin-like domain
MDDDVVYLARLHWILFMGPALLFLFAVATQVLVNYRPLEPMITLLMVFAAAWAATIWVTYHFSSLTIKKKQLILRTGFFVRQTIDIPLLRIESIDIRQSILGSLLHYGSLVIIGTGGSRQYMHNLAKPLTCRRYIEQLMHQ